MENKALETDLLYGIYIVRNGLLINIKPPTYGYGSDEIIWQKG